MPLYPYRCTQCGHKFEKIQHFNSEPEKVCPKCGGVLERPLTAPGLNFKGAGWYVNDYAPKSSAGSSTGSSAAASEAAADAKSDNKSDTKSETKSNAKSAGPVTAAQPLPHPRGRRARRQAQHHGEVMRAAPRPDCQVGRS